jgi:hypothetical protein
MRSVLAIAPPASLVIAAPVAHADPAAEQLFQEGRDLLAKGDIPAACDRFERSQALEPRVGTLLNLGSCREEQGHLADAWEAFTAAHSLATAARDGRAPDAAARAAALAPKLAHLTIRVPDEHPDGLVVTRHGKPLPEAAWGIEGPMDPGRYEITAKAPGFLAWSTTVELAIGEHGETAVPPLDVDPDAPKPIVPGGDEYPDVHPKVGFVSVGAAFGGNSETDILGGLRIIGSYPVRHGAVRATLQGLYTRFHPEPYNHVDHYAVGLGFDYLWAWGKNLASAAGVGFGIDLFDNNWQDHVTRESWVSARVSPFVLRLGAPKLEVGAHFEFVLPEKITLGVLAVDWFVW